ncbi:MAG: hypothetical protein LBG48_00455, partial [Rickettsiales bacterium]|nr:hypothetical protein [Rickettsiales bacterium]
MKDYNPPKNKDIKDAALTIPLLSEPLAHLLDTLITPSLEKRRDEWLEEVGQCILDHENKISSLESLRLNEHFIDIAIEASRI